MKHTLVLRSPEIAKRAGEILATLVRGDELHEVIIRPYKKDRSVAQNSIYWKFLTVIAGELGETKEHVHERYKERFLINIYERDDIEFATMVEAVRNVYKGGMKKDALLLRNKIVKLTSTTNANVKQMSEYINDIEMDARNLGILLPIKDDMYSIAMGV